MSTRTVMSERDEKPVVPVIDIAPFLTGNAEAKRGVVRTVGAACSHTGFYMIENHGIDAKLFDRMAAVTLGFFALPEREKLRSAGVGGNPGYRPVASRQLAATRDSVTPPDLKEGFSLGPWLEYRNLENGYMSTPDGRKWFTPNVWPEEPPEFRATWTEYFRAMDALAATLMRISALALELPESYFDDKIDRHITRLNANGYPQLQRPPLPGQLRAGAHSDYGALTILWKDDGFSTLEVVDKRGTWQSVAPPPGCLIINIGDLLSRWTNDRWVSTLHRVVVAENLDNEPAARLSLPFFFTPNYDAVVETIETCIDDEHPRHYEPVTVSKYYDMKVSKHVAAAESTY
jgi:isopenicillin N synthase-like dioxygenase